MYGMFEFAHEHYKVIFNAGELVIDEFYSGDDSVDHDFVSSIKISMNDLRDIYREADNLYRALDVEKGDRVVLSDEFLNRGGILAERYKNTVGVVEEVLTDWDADDFICWDFHVKFNGNVSGVHWGDVRKI